MKIPIFDFPSQKNLILERAFPKELKEEEIEQTCKKIINDIKKNGDEAVRRYTRDFDRLQSTEYKQNLTLNKDLAILAKGLNDETIEALEVAIENVTKFHKSQKFCDTNFLGEMGEKLQLKVRPIKRAGIYVPGGTSGNTPLISSLIMSAIPAQIAGVEEIIVATPPKMNGEIDECLQYLLVRLGIKNIYLAGGAQAIAAMAYGTESLKKVNIISGPGNAYVNWAKKMVFGQVMIDGLYGHSEIVVISDGTSNEEHIAADMLSQAEHAGAELSALITTDRSHADKVIFSIEEQLKKLARKNEIHSSLSLRGLVAIAPDLSSAVDLANQIAPEHLELLVKDELVDVYEKKIENAGTIFIGSYASEPIGDYICGTNHVLPTGGAARFGSPLSVQTFLKSSNIIRYNKKAFEHYAPHAMELARKENLDAHYQALKIRMK